MSGLSPTVITADRHLQITKALFFIIVGFVALAILAALLIVQYNLHAWDLGYYGNIPGWTMAAVSLASLIVSKRIFNKGITAAKNSLKPLIDKLNRYRSTLLVYLAICEVTAMLNIVVYIFTSDLAYLIFAAVLLGSMLAVMPLKRRLVAELQLDSLQEKELS